MYESTLLEKEMGKMSLLERRKRIITLISIATILVLLGITGVWLLISNKLNISKSTIDGLSTEKGLLEVLEEEEEDKNKDEEESSDQLEDFTPEEMKQLQYVMMKTGIGYKNEMFDEEEWANALEDPHAALEKTDKEGEITNIEKLYMLYNGKKEEDRPEYLESPEELKQDDAKFKEDKEILEIAMDPPLNHTVCHITAQLEYNGETYTSGEYTYVQAWYPDDPPEDMYYKSEEEAKEKAFNDVKKRVEYVYRKSEWLEWITARNAWIGGSADNLVEKGPGEDCDD